ncbi:hypothetical protein WJX81_001677 [Elliptochloris bilobata]|uniref:Tetratricopeptide repeat protein n=1 Tax=Elliptochloris bilobata TaxID=381761 RepID=A0AAW1RY05_9CHLO
MLARDRKLAGAADDELPPAFLDELEREQIGGGSDSKQGASGRSDSSAEGASTSSDVRELGVRTAGEAIEAGIARLNDGQAEAAIELFQAALELPGNGAFRMSGTVREYRCASDAEEQSALYNMACAYTGMGKRDSALTCLEACLAAGFQDFATLRSDPDLAALRGAELDKLLSRYDGLLAKVFKRRRAPDGPGARPWFEVM